MAADQKLHNWARQKKLALRYDEERPWSQATGPRDTAAVARRSAAAARGDRSRRVRLEARPPTFILIFRTLFGKL